jgi:lysophospholipase L1-like esterase
MRLGSNRSGFFGSFLMPMIAALTVFGIGAPQATHSQNLVPNGSFESPGSASDQYTVNFGTLPVNYITGWSLGISGIASLPSQTPGGNDYDGICGGDGLNDAGNYEDGTNCIFLQGGMAATTVTLSPGIYTLSFWAMGRVDGGNGVNPVWVTVENGGGIIFSNTVTPQNTAQNQLSDWTQYLFNFSIMNSGQYSLAFQSAIPYGSGHDHMTFLDNVSILEMNLVTNGSFETVTPPVTSSIYTTSFGSLPTNAVSNWTFGTSAGTAYSGIVIDDGTLGVQTIENGSNAAFVQGVGSISQNVALPAGSYALSFYAMGRTSANGGDGADPTTISVGNLLSQTFMPDNAAENNIIDWIPYSYDFTVPVSGIYTLQFSGDDPFVSGSDDHTTFIDNVCLTPLDSIPPPSIISEPPSQQVLYVGQRAQFTVQSAGTPPISCQWQIESNGTYVNLVNGGRISGAASATLIINNLNGGDSTNYEVLLSNAGGMTNSTIATLTVQPVPPATPRSTVTVINPSFEDSRVTNDTCTTGYGTLDPQNGVPGWQFSSSGGDSFSGIVTESGTVFGTPKHIPDCWQAAFIQGTGQFSQPVNFQSAGTYVIRFQAEGPDNGEAGSESISVLIDGNVVGTFTPLTAQWTLYDSNPFNVTSGVHNITFAGTIPFSVSNRTTFIDALEIVTPAEATAVIPPISPVYNIVFVGDSITYGATLANPATQASAVQCMQSLGTRFNMAVRMSNQGHSGSTTVDWLPSSPYNTGYFQAAVAAAATLETNESGQLIFSIMLGANDSAQSGTDGSPVPATNYQQNLQVIIDQFLTNFPDAFVFVHYPTWYSTNTHNGALYGPAGAALLKTYMPAIDLLVASNTVLHPEQVFVGDKLAYGYFETNYLTLLTPESGVDGTFYLHPNAAGATVLGAFWANAIIAPLNLTSNDAYVAWLQSSDLTPGAPGSGFSDTTTNSLISNGVSYGNPDGLSAAFTNNRFDVSADVRDDNNLTVILEESSDLINWNLLSWTNAVNQNDVAPGFTRDEFQVPISFMSREQFYRLILNYY